MSDWPYSDVELEEYFSNPSVRQKTAPGGGNGKRSSGFWARVVDTPQKRQAAVAVGSVATLCIVGMLGVLLYFFTISDELPPLEEIDSPKFQLATVAYTADGEELARYARENRSWVTYAEISQNVVNALVSTEDHRFHDHWGIDVVRTASIPYHVARGKPQGGSTLSQQLARNLYNKHIGREVTVNRKLKEMVTAVQLEKRYTKREIIEMYLNTVEFGNNAFGIEAAARTFFGKRPIHLDTLESATLVGMLKAISRYNPVRNPEASQARRNTVLGQMVKRGMISSAYLETNRDTPVVAKYHSSEITASSAPYFAEAVRLWLNDWGRENGHDIYADGLVVFTTLDSRLQALAQQAFDRQMAGLQAVVNYEWSRASGYEVGTSTDAYVNRTDHEPFAYFWSSQRETVESFIKESPNYKALREQNVSPGDAIEQLSEDTAFMDSLRAEKSRLEGGLVSLDPQTGYVKTWIGGTNLTNEWYDHVGQARRQPGSTFKAFVYTAAIDNGYSPYHTLQDTTFLYTDVIGNEWNPTNSGDPGSGEYMTLRDGLAQSKNTVTGRLVLMVGPQATALYARRMGIESPLEEVPALALGVSDVTLLEMTSAYATLASGGLRYDPILVSRVEDKYGNVLHEATPAPKEALSEETAFTMVDMLRGVVRDGTGRRLNFQFMLGDFDLAGKTGTTQNNADGWFVGMHPQLVTGAWVGFNDRRIAFRSNWWGQGAHNALLIVGDFLQQALNDPDSGLQNQRFRMPAGYSLPLGPLDPSQNETDETLEHKDNRRERGKVGW